MPFTSDVADLLAATSGGSTGGGSSFLSFLPLIAIVGIGYLLLIRPARNRQRRALETRTSVTPGAEVTTTAGLLATVVAVDDETVTLEVAPGVHSRYLKGAIARVHDVEGPPGADAAADAGTPSLADDSSAVVVDTSDTETTDR